MYTWHVYNVFKMLKTLKSWIAKLKTLPRFSRCQISLWYLFRIGCYIFTSLPIFYSNSIFRPQSEMTLFPSVTLYNCSVRQRWFNKIRNHLRQKKYIHMFGNSNKFYLGLHQRKKLKHTTRKRWSLQPINAKFARNSSCLKIDFLWIVNINIQMVKLFKLTLLFLTTNATNITYNRRCEFHNPNYISIRKHLSKYFMCTVLNQKIKIKRNLV